MFYATGKVYLSSLFHLFKHNLGKFIHIRKQFVFVCFLQCFYDDCHMVNGMVRIPLFIHFIVAYFISFTPNFLYDFRQNRLVLRIEF